MTITEALRILRNTPKDASPFEVILACGFTPLHIQTFVAAHLQVALPRRRVVMIPGLYGDLANTVEKAAERQSRNIAVVIEWADLDPRLGYRASSRWDGNTPEEIVSFVSAALKRMAAAIAKAANAAKVAVSLPTLPVPPFFHTPGFQLSQAEAQLADLIAAFGFESARVGAGVVNGSAFDSAVAARHDLKSDLLLGLPYTLKHADELAGCIARTLYPLPPKKGIITDLDDTLWLGLVGELGPDGVHWSLERHSAFHALYQTLLSSLAAQGVLVGVASKNRLEDVEAAFRRADILLPPERVFPMEVHWNAKSSSVQRILKTWNVGADSVVFVDDSPMELAEVAAAHPGIECIRFPGTDYEAGSTMLRRIRDLFGKQRLTEEDGIRLSSIRHSAQFAENATGSASESFLQQANAIVTCEFLKSGADSRALELVNKTNQFNLNGVRYTESDWEAELARQDTELLVASYEDRFGLLGKIAVMLGRLNGDTLHCKVWVMSCRAFSRRIEYVCLRTCFERYQVRQVEFDFAATSRNAPLQEFLGALFGSQPGSLALTRERFAQVCPPLYHTVRIKGLEFDGQYSESANKVL